MTEWPQSKKFAFTFCDDTDFATLQNVKPVYDFIASTGMRTTKLVWPLNGGDETKNAGDTCENDEYVRWLVELQSQGFEIALHNVAGSSSTRETIERGLARFQDLFGSSPTLHCNHTGCLDNLYWGSSRVTGWRRSLYDLWTRGKNKNISLGHVPGDPHFWGDLCKEMIPYVRNFTCDAVNSLKFSPEMPYHDRSKPYVNFWFAATNASSPKYFRRNFSMSSIDELIEERGLCLAYVHFGAGFYSDGAIDSHFRKIVEYVASQDGWFAPVTEILNHLRGGSGPGDRLISPLALIKLELKWFNDKYGKKTGI